MAARAFIDIRDDTLVLSGVLDYESVMDIDTQAQDWIKISAPAQSILDASAVTYSSSAGMALLIGWLRAAKLHGKTLQICHLPSDMQALAKVSGLEKILV